MLSDVDLIEGNTQRYGITLPNIPCRIEPRKLHHHGRLAAFNGRLGESKLCRFKRRIRLEVA